MRWSSVVGAIALVFGALTVVSGGSVLFGPQSVRAAAGDVVLPVLWFNFLSGLAYVVAGIAMLRRRAWARVLAGLIAASIALMLAVLVVLILAGTPWEPRTLGAMTLRLVFWILAFWVTPKGPVGPI